MRCVTGIRKNLFECSLSITCFVGGGELPFCHSFIDMCLKYNSFYVNCCNYSIAPPPSYILSVLALVSIKVLLLIKKINVKKKILSSVRVVPYLLAEYVNDSGS